MQKLHQENKFGEFDFESYDTYESCLMGKLPKQPFTRKGISANEVLELIYTDVCSSMSIHARGGFSYFITFTDDFSRYG